MVIIKIITKDLSFVDIVAVTAINSSIKNSFRKQGLLKRYSTIIKLLVVNSKSVKHSYFLVVNSNSSSLVMLIKM